MEIRLDRIAASYARTRCRQSAALPLGIENRLAAALEYDALAGISSLRGIEAAKRLGKGTGLGLSQVHGFAHQTGGTVTVRSKFGSGTTIILYLPRCERNMGAVDYDSECVARRTGTALLVEDNPAVATATSLLLEQLGYKVVTAENANVALKILARCEIGLVISDIAMGAR